MLFFFHLETRRVKLAGFTPYADQEWMEQQARNMTMEEWGGLRGCRYLHSMTKSSPTKNGIRDLIASASPIRKPNVMFRKNDMGPHS